uniref:Uncharacterized protein n=1 Tax=Tanacetum cinerariifolium TaxID=118510 RepID=A0A6L2NF94_TANCI|nr:hypothetical protein [Tanacetum cinerariifolium]
MEEIKMLDEKAHEWLVERNPNSWCRAYFDMNICSVTFENEISESFNSRILGARGKPIITMLEEISVYLIQRMWCMNKLTFDNKDSITPSVISQMEFNKKIQRHPTENEDYAVTKEDRVMQCYKCWETRHNKTRCTDSCVVLSGSAYKAYPSRSSDRGCTDRMADVNAPSDQTPTMAPPVRTDDQILPHIRWIPIRKSNCYLDLEKSQSNPIYKITVDLLKNTNFFRAFTASSDLPSIYIQQFWDTILYDKKAGCYKCQLDEQCVRFTKLIIHHLQRKHRFHPRPDSPLHLSNEEPVLGYLKFSAKGTKREIFGMPILGRLITANIRAAPYYQEYQENAAKHRGFLADETRSTQDLPAPRLAKLARKPQGSPKSVGASEAKEVPAKEPQVAEEDANFLKAVEESRKDTYALPKGRSHQWSSGNLSRENINLSQKCQERARRKCLRIRQVSEPTASSFYDVSPYEVLGQSDSEEESEKVVLGVEKGSQDEDQAGPDLNAQAEGQTGLDTGAQAEGQAGSNPDETSEGQAGSNPDETSEVQAGPDPGNAEARVQSTSSPVVHAGSDREHMDTDDTDVANVTLQPSMEQLYEGFTATIYPNVQENLKLAVEEPVLLEEPVSSSGTLSSLQHLSRDFTFGDQFLCDKPSDADKSVETKVESMVNVPIQQAMSSISLMTSPIIDLTSRPESPKELPQLKATTIDTTKTTTTTLPPPHALQQSTTEVSIAVSEVVTDAVDWAMQAPLRNHFRDLPEADMKEILHQRMWETDSYKSHEVHMQLFEAVEKSINCVQSEELAHDLAKARKKKKKSRESPKTPPGSPSNQPPPPPPPAGSAALSPAKTVATIEHQAWLTPDVMLKPLVFLTPDDLDLDEAMSLDEQAQLSNEQDIGSAHILMVNLRQGWWKPFEVERPTTPEPAWSIRSSDVPVPPNNWASTLASNYSPPPEDSLLAQTGDITTFIDWFCKRRGISELKPQDQEGPAYEIVKVFHPDVIHLQYQMEECHKLLTDSVDDPILRHNVSEPLPLGGSKGRRPTLSISKMKAAYYPDAGLEQMVPGQFWIEEECKYDIAAMYGISHWWFQRQRFYIDRHTSEGDRSTVKTHMRIVSVTQVNLTKPQWTATGFEYKHDYTVIEFPRAVIFRDKYGVQMMMRFNEIHKFSDGTLQQIVEALDYRVKEFRINRMNPGQNTRFWTRKDVDRCNAFMFSIQRRLRTRRIFRNLESFIGGRVREGDYRLLKRTD